MPHEVYYSDSVLGQPHPSALPRVILICPVEGLKWLSPHHIHVFEGVGEEVVALIRMSICFFFKPLQILIPRVEMRFFINHYFIVCLFKYHTSLHGFP